jgi:hypothetical protein
MKISISNNIINVVIIFTISFTIRLYRRPPYHSEKIYCFFENHILRALDHMIIADEVYCKKLYFYA